MHRREACRRYHPSRFPEEQTRGCPAQLIVESAYLQRLVCLFKLAIRIVRINAAAAVAETMHVTSKLAWRGRTEASRERQE